MSPQLTIRPTRSATSRLLGQLEAARAAAGGPGEPRPPQWGVSSAVMSDPPGPGLAPLYRYRLERRAGGIPDNYPALTFLMLNPSTADGSEDDPTVKKCWGFAWRAGFLRLVIVNLYAWRATDRSELTRADDPVGPKNLHHIAKAVCESQGPVIAAWGCDEPVLPSHDARVRRALAVSDRDIRTLRLNARNRPWHPLYVPYSAVPQPWLSLDAACPST